MITDMKIMFTLRAQQQLDILGFWFPPRNGQQFGYKMLTFLSFFLIYSMAISYLVYIINVWGDLDKTSEAIFMMFILTSVAYKMTNFFLNMNSLVELFDMMDDEIFVPKNKKGIRIMEFQARRVRYICMFFFCLVCSTCSLWAGMPLVDGSDKYTLPFNVWIPFRVDRSPIFEITYIYQITAIFISGLLFNGIDNVPLSMIMFSCGQIQIVRDKVLEMEQTAEDITHGASHRGNMYRHLSDCAKHHQTIIAFIKRVEHVYHSNIFFHVCGSYGIICLVGFRLYVVDPFSCQFFSMISFLCAMLMQLYNYCWCGHKLSTTADSLRDAMYLCPWYEQNRSFNRSLWIVMERMKIPLEFRTGKHVVLSFATFLTILRSSYSYFAVLKQVRDK